MSEENKTKLLVHVYDDGSVEAFTNQGDIDLLVVDFAAPELKRNFASPFFEEFHDDGQERHYPMSETKVQVNEGMVERAYKQLALQKEYEAALLAATDSAVQPQGENDGN